MLVACANKPEQEKSEIVEMTISRSIFALLKSEKKTASQNRERSDPGTNLQINKSANEQNDPIANATANASPHVNRS
jgi:hypothetical protein